MTEPEQRADQEGFESTMLGQGGEVPMPSSAAESRDKAGTEEDQEVAEERVAHEHRVAEGYVRPGEPHSD